MILDTYITRLFNSQLDTNHLNSNISSCFIKLDTPIENVDYDTILTLEDFDIILFGRTNEEYISENNFNLFERMSVRNRNNIRLTYFFSNEGMFSFNNEYLYANDFEQFNGRKITAIGFGFSNAVFAFLDTNNMNIIINGREGITITRDDLLQSDGVCKDIEYPLHLVNDIANYDLKNITIGGVDYQVKTKAGFIILILMRRIYYF